MAGASVALKNFELENKITVSPPLFLTQKEISASDAIYKYDAEKHRRLCDARPWDAEYVATSDVLTI